jgi:hypothetical protein
MKRKNILLAVILVMSFLPALPAMTQETKDMFVHLGPGVPGVLYEPVTLGPKSEIGVFVMHAEVDYLQFSACSELSKRGYRVLCANNSASKSGTNNDLSIDRALLDAKLGVTYLRKYPGIRKVVLLGHSGGGALMSAYQNIAENGLKACQGPEKLLKCPDSLAELPAADGLILMDANYGMSAMTLLSLDPAVVDETTGRTLDAKLDLFNAQNGFNPNGSNYSNDFIRRFQAAVAKREKRLIAAALDRLEKINGGTGRFSDDEPFVVPGASYLGFNNKLFAQDTRLLSHTHNAWPLLHKDGSMTTQIVHTVRLPDNATSNTPSLDRGALKTTVRKFLSTYALRVNDDFGYDEDSMRGVDWLSSYTVPAGNVQSVTVPLLAMGMTGHWEYLNSELIYERSSSADKTIVFVEGANHNFTTCERCEKFPGEFGDTLKTTFDYVGSWLSKPGRF